MTATWPMLHFNEVFEDISAGQPKTLTRDFLSAGRFPLVDQGQELVGGYADDERQLATVPLPVIVFGDHTRAVKYVDFPFGVGADGVKLLRPRRGGHVQYLFRMLQAARVPATGYDRHFKHLKRLRFPIPPIEEQRRIAAVLDRADDLRAKRQSSLALIAMLSELIFLDMFGERAHYEVVALGSLTELITKGTTPTSVGLPFAECGVPFLRAQDLIGEVVDPTQVAKFISADTHRSLQRSVVRANDVLLSIAGTVGRSALVASNAPEMNCNQAVALIRCGDAARPGYVAAWLKTDDALRQITGAKVTATISNLSLAVIARLTLPVPPLEEQVEFERRVHQARSLNSAARAAAAEVDCLFATLQHRAFSGLL